VREALLDHVDAHLQVGVEVPARVLLVRPDAADLCSKVDDQLWPHRAEQIAHRVALDQVAVTAARDGDLGAAQRAQLLDNGRAEKAGTAGHEDAFVRKLHGRRRMIPDLRLRIGAERTC
jgi:hypothetical protein